MGLVRSIENLNRSIDQEKEELKIYRHEQAMQRMKADTQKANITRYKQDLIIFINSKVKETIKNEGFEYYYLLYNIKTKELMLQCFFLEIQQEDIYGTKIPYKRELEIYFNDIYFKQIKKLEAEYKKHFEPYQQQQEYIKQLAIQQQETQYQKDMNKIDSINKTTMILLAIFCFPLFLIFMLFGGIMRSK